GPYLHLPEGSYRLSFRCEAGSPRMAGQPVLGLEIIVLSRFQQGWQDFTAAELQTGGGSLIFEVPPGHSIESPDAGRFEFRFFHFGNASLTITSVELERHSPRVELAPEPRRWRMVGRLQTSWIGARDGRRRALRLPPPPPRPRAFTDRRSRSYEARRRRARARRAAAPAAAERAPRGAPPDRYHRQLPIRNAAPGFRAYRGIEPTLRNQIPFCRSAAEPARLRRARFGALRHPARPGPSQLGHISVAR